MFKKEKTLNQSEVISGERNRLSICFNHHTTHSIWIIHRNICAKIPIGSAFSSRTPLLFCFPLQAIDYNNKRVRTIIKSQIWFECFTLVVTVGNVIIYSSVNQIVWFQKIETIKEKWIRYYLIIYSLDFSFVDLSMWWIKLLLMMVS